MVRELHEFLATEILARELDKSLNEIEESGVVEYAGDGAVADFHGVGRDFARENAMRSDSENVDGVVRLFPRDAIGLGVDDKQALRGEEQNQRALIDRAMNHVFVLEIHDLFSNQNAHVFHAAVVALQVLSFTWRLPRMPSSGRLLWNATLLIVPLMERSPR